MKNPFTTLFIVLALSFTFSISCTRQDDSDNKVRISDQGWTFESPTHWQMAFHSLDRKSEKTGVIIASPDLNGFHNGKIKKGIYFYYEPKPWPHTSLNQAHEELRNNKENKDIKFIKLHGIEWLINKRKTEQGDFIFARTLLKPKEYFMARGESLDSEKELVEFLKGVSTPKPE